MKKATVSLLCILFAAMCLLLHSCISTGSGNNISGENRDNEEAFFELENFNYNTAYTSQKAGEKGFLLYDDVDFNSVLFDSHIIDSSSIYFEIWQNGALLNTLYKMPKTGFGYYRVDKKGAYNIKVFAQKNKGDEVSGSFDFNVIAMGRPDNVQFEIKNSHGEIVDKVKGGDSYTFTAKIYSDNEQITLKDGDFYWKNPSNAGNYKSSYTVGNIVYERQQKFDFYCFATNNRGERINIVNNTFAEVDNLIKTEQFPEGIYYSYGIDTSLPITMNVNAADQPYFYNGIAAEYRFEGGEVETIPISNKHEEGKFSLFISYGGSDANVYSLSHYDYSVDNSGKKITNYFDNDVKYQFDPTQNSARVYLAVWQRHDTDVGYTLLPTKIESSVLDIALTNDAPETFRISSISGSHKNDTALYATTYKRQTKNIVDNSVEWYVCCDMNGNGKNDDEYYNKTLSDIEQYFIINVAANTGSLWDYTMNISFSGVSAPIVFQKYENAALGIFDRYFVCPNIGYAQITVKSKFTDKESIITVNIVDKVFESAKQIDRDGLSEYFVFSTVDFSQKIKIKEYRLSSYNKDKYYLRSLRNDETLEYLRNNTVTSPDNFAFADNGALGQTITVRIVGTSVTSEINRVFIVPKFAFYINGNYYETKDIVDAQYYAEVIGSENNPSLKKDFYGAIQVMDYIKGGETINYLSFAFEGEYTGLEGEADKFSYQFYDKNNYFEVRYKFDYQIGTNIYNAQVLKIFIK